MKLLVKKTQKNENNGNNGVVPVAGEFSSGEIHGGRTVLVGVRLDQQSKELLTWALMKVAQPGDLVVALHVLHSSTEVEQSTLLSLVKTFDSTLAVYEGFCNLKQVDLKLKVCRGSSLRKILVRESKGFESATLILGTCKAQHMIRSPTSVAKYCARKLSNNFSVFAVDNGKIVYRREGGNCKMSRLVLGSKVDNVEVDDDGSSSIKSMDSGLENCDGFEKISSGARRSTLIKRYFGCGPISAWADYACDEMLQESCTVDREDKSMALVPYQAANASSDPKYVVNQELNELKPGWQLVRRVFLPRHHETEKVPSRKTSLVRRVLRIPGKHSSMAVHPDRKRREFAQMDDHSSDLSAESGAIVPVGDAVASVPSSPINGFKYLVKELEGVLEKYSSTCRLFAYQELVSATSNFAPENMVGKGGSSQVYRGCLSDGKELAVKILKPSEDALQEFIAEIEIITTINYKNIITLVGFCFDEVNLILVYDFLSRGSLEENLHGNETKAGAFGWEERYKVAVGVAEALDYIHNRDSQTVIHRDVKSSNILLSDEFEPQLADFGLATWASRASSYLTSSDVAGTFGYLAPEYFMHGKVTDKMDVYSFGVVLLELLSGRKPIDSSNPKGKESLVIWANSKLKDEKMSQLLDTRLGSDYDHEQIERMVLTATLCIRREPQTRPRIGNVLKLLQGDIEVINWAKQQVSNYPEEFEVLDGETPRSDIQSHLNVALLDIIEDDAASVSSTEPNISLEDYLKGRWSRTSSFD
ncbi:rust resistance kinase Lr10-like isoform X1 [Chenopodium quinoa]|uniref:Protein kinase domain-containing protein n=1 Tax=Chenopodium quinoa TaxID=63459 RepID=A0A803L4R7_CHEQI|nr:rust resistance kinase Lr10-like isoform X1 [Chenopodium quinoa]